MMAEALTAGPFCFGKRAAAAKEWLWRRYALLISQRVDRASIMISPYGANTLDSSPQLLGTSSEPSTRAESLAGQNGWSDA